VNLSELSDDEKMLSYAIGASKSSGEARHGCAPPVRVIGGLARGRRLHAPSGRQTRPTSDYLREVLFDLLGQHVAGRSFLDLYAGTGAVGIEALSRGAARAVFVEHDRSAVAWLQRNLETSGLMGKAEVVPAEVLRYLRRAASASHQFDMIFLDPPYRGADAATALSLIASKGLLAPAGMVIVERSFHAASFPAPGAIAQVREVRHGDSILALYRWEAV